MLKKMLLAASCVVIFDGTNGMYNDIEDPVVYQRTMLRNITHSVVSTLSSETQKKIPNNPALLMDVFFRAGHAYITQDEPDIYQAHFIERLLDKPYYIFDLFQEEKEEHMIPDSQEGKEEHMIPDWDNLGEEEQNKIYEISHEYRDLLEQQMETMSKLST